MTTTPSHPPGECERSLRPLELAALYLDEAADRLLCAAREVALAASEAPSDSSTRPNILQHTPSGSLASLARLAIDLDKDIPALRARARGLRAVA